MFPRTGRCVSSAPSAFFFFFFANKDVLNKGHGIMMHDLLQPTSYRYNRPHRQVTKSEGGIIHIFYSLKILKYM